MKKNPFLNRKVNPQDVIAFRQARRESHEQFAVSVGVSFYTVKGWERGLFRPGPLSCRRLSELWEQQNANA
jgi:DNA-binding transcriptional regulator YiaG